MDTVEYAQLLSEAPDHNAPEFLDFLRNNNRVIFEGDVWLVVENIKYHKPEAKYHTAFIKHNALRNTAFKSIMALIDVLGYHTWEIKIKRPADRSINRFHVHFIEKGSSTVLNG